MKYVQLREIRTIEIRTYSDIRKVDVFYLFESSLRLIPRFFFLPAGSGDVINFLLRSPFDCKVNIRSCNYYIQILMICIYVGLAHLSKFKSSARSKTISMKFLFRFFPYVGSENFIVHDIMMILTSSKLANRPFSLRFVAEKVKLWTLHYGKRKKWKKQIISCGISSIELMTFLLEYSSSLTRGYVIHEFIAQ